MSQTPELRFYSPWTIREGSRGFQVEDATGFPLFYVPFEDEAGRAIAERRMSRKQAMTMVKKITDIMNTLEKFQQAIDRRAGSQRLTQPVRKAPGVAIATLPPEK